MGWEPQNEDELWANVWDALIGDDPQRLVAAIGLNVNLLMRPEPPLQVQLPLRQGKLPPKTIMTQLPGRLRKGPPIILAAAFLGAVKCVTWLATNGADLECKDCSGK